MLKKLHKACMKYPSWKADASPNLKPWLFPEQQTLQRVDLAKCKPRDYKNNEEIVDESNLTETNAAEQGSDDEWTTTSGQNGNAS